MAQTDFRTALLIRTEGIIDREQDTIGPHDLVTVADITRLYRQDKHNLDLLRRVVAVEALLASWRDYFGERLITAGGRATA